MNFSLFGIPIKLNPSFFLTQMAVGTWIVFQYPATPLVRGIVLGLLVCLVLLSVLVHEMGHALEARRAGAAPNIVLVWFGGVTRFMPTMSTARKLWIAAAGVVYQLVAAGAVWFVLQQSWFETAHPAIDTTARVFVFYNLLLAAVNMVPLGGMDGGAMLENLLELIGVPRAKTVILGIYVAGGVGLALWGFSKGSIPLGLAGMYLTYAGIRSQSRFVKVEKDAKSHNGVEQRVHALLVEGRPEEVTQIGRDIYESAGSPEYRQYGATILAMALRIAGDTEELAELLPALEGTAINVAELAAGYEAIDRPADALRVLEPQAMRERDPAVLEYLATLYIKAGRPDRAAQIIIDNPETARRNAVIDIHQRLVDADALPDAEAVRQAVSANRDVPPGHVAPMLIAEGNEAQAIALLQRDYDFAATASACGWLGWALHETGQVEEASLLLKEALGKGIDPDSSLWIQALLHRSGHYESAAEFGDAAVTADPPPAFANYMKYNLACSLTQLGRHDAAVGHLMDVDTDLLLGQMPTDADLIELRSFPGFADVVARFHGNNSDSAQRAHPTEGATSGR